MKSISIVAIFLVLFVGVANAQRHSSYHTSGYSNYNTTYKQGNGYSSIQSYSTPTNSTLVNTNRNYNNGGGYSSTTTVYSGSSPKSSYQTYNNGVGGTNTVKTKFDASGNIIGTTNAYKCSEAKSTLLNWNK